MPEEKRLNMADPAEHQSAAIRAARALIASAAAHPSYAVASITGLLGIALAIWMLLQGAGADPKQPARDGPAAKGQPGASQQQRNELLAMQQFERDGDLEDEEGASSLPEVSSRQGRDETIFTASGIKPAGERIDTADASNRPALRGGALPDDDFEQGGTSDSNPGHPEIAVDEKVRAASSRRNARGPLPDDEEFDNAELAESEEERQSAASSSPGRPLLSGAGKSASDEEEMLESDNEDLPAGVQPPLQPLRAASPRPRPGVLPEEEPHEADADETEEPKALALPVRGARSGANWKGAEGKPLPSAVTHSSQESQPAETVILPVEGRRAESARAPAATTRVASGSAEQVSIEVAGPESCAAGEKLEYRVVITNHGRAAVRNVLLWVDLPPGLEHPQGPQIEHEVAALLGGQSHRVPLRLTARSAGRGFLEARAVLAGKPASSATFNVNVRASAKGSAARGP
jgi:uncharacterized repeat protein (TIGR01451 family)